MRDLPSQECRDISSRSVGIRSVRGGMLHRVLEASADIDADVIPFGTAV